MDDLDIRTWYMMVVGLAEPFLHGQFVFKFRVPEEFPMRPPSIEALTPNGVFELGGPLCISIGEFHEQHKTWVPALGMPGCGRQMWNALLCFEAEDAIQPAIRVIHSSDEEKQRLANASRAYNRECLAELMTRFDDYADAYPDYVAVKHFRGT